MGGDNLPSLVGIGLTDPPNIGGGGGAGGPPVPASLISIIFHGHLPVFTYVEA